MLREADDFISSVDGQVDWRAGSFETSKLEEIDKTLMNRSDSTLGDGVTNGGCSGKPPGAGTKADGRIS